MAPLSGVRLLMYLWNPIYAKRLVPPRLTLNPANDVLAVCLQCAVLNSSETFLNSLSFSTAMISNLGMLVACVGTILAFAPYRTVASPSSYSYRTHCVDECINNAFSGRRVTSRHFNSRQFWKLTEQLLKPLLKLIRELIIPSQFK